MTKVITDDEVLAACNVEFMCYDFDEPITIRIWLSKVLSTLIIEEEGFSGKRPFGNGGWLSYLAIPFVMTGLLENEYFSDGTDEDEYESEYYPKDRVAARKLVLRAVELLSKRL